MYVTKQHKATGQIADGFYLVETDVIGMQVFRVKTHPETAERWAGLQVVALASLADVKGKKARAFYEWCVITDGTPPFRIPDEVTPTLYQSWRENLRTQLSRLSDDVVEAHLEHMKEQETKHRKAFLERLPWAWDGRLYRLTRMRNKTYDEALWEATLALLDASDEQQDNSGRMYALALNRCRICNRKLTHPDSRATGIGPECAETSRHVEIVSDVPAFSAPKREENLAAFAQGRLF